MNIIRYKLYNEPRYPAMQQVLYNRGLDLEEQRDWLDAGWFEVNDWENLSEGQMLRAVATVRATLENNKKVLVVVDSDCDGFSSSAILINYIKARYPTANVDHMLHDGKQHGLADLVEDIVDGDYDLVIVPDAGSSDFDQHKALSDAGMKVVVLDHHQCEKYSDYAIVVNNQMCDYPNKALCGAGVTWQFCRAYEETVFGICDGYPNDLLDLCAFGNISDMMDYKSIETKAIIDLGLRRIRNPFLYAMITKNRSSIERMSGGLAYMSVAFYITPYVNAICRSGTSDEKKVVFESMLTGNNGMVEEAVKTVLKVKSRQGDLVAGGMEEIEAQIKDKGLDKNPVIVVVCDPDRIMPEIAGLVANKLQSQYMKPSLVLLDRGDTYSGSGRNFSQSPLQDFREICEKAGASAMGHSAAFGCTVPAGDFDTFTKKLYSAYDGIDMTPVYVVDFVLRGGPESKPIVLAVDGMKHLWGQGLAEPYVAVENVELSMKAVTLMSPDKNPTLKIKMGNCEIIKFKSSQREYTDFIRPNSFLSGVCRCSVNEWRGKKTPQLILEDYTVERNKWVF